MTHSAMFVAYTYDGKPVTAHATNIAEWDIYSVTGTHKDEITLT